MAPLPRAPPPNPTGGEECQPDPDGPYGPTEGAGGGEADNAIVNVASVIGENGETQPQETVTTAEENTESRGEGARVVVAVGQDNIQQQTRGRSMTGAKTPQPVFQSTDLRQRKGAPKTERGGGVKRGT